MKNLYNLISTQLNELHIVSVIDFLVEHGFDINQRGINDAPMLLDACKDDLLDVVQRLIELNVDVNIQDNHGSTALNIASEYNRIDIVNAILEYDDKSINVIDNDGDTPLICASWKNNTPVIKALVEHNADINIKNKDNKSCINYAFEIGISIEDIKTLYHFEIPEIKINTLELCLICNQKNIENQLVKCNHCKNYFCYSCIISWFQLKNNYVNKCPYCINKWKQAPIIYIYE